MDFLSSLHTFTLNPLAQRVHLTLHTLISIDTQVTFMWIPGIINQQKHDAVDSVAKSEKINADTPVSAYDYKNHFRSLVLQSWNLTWKNQTNNETSLNQTHSSPWTSSIRISRREKVTPTCLSIGHTRLTHSYLLNPYILFRPSCPPLLQWKLDSETFLFLSLSRITPDHL